jgi:small subunit ribosomal protein S20
VVGPAASLSRLFVPEEQFQAVANIKSQIKRNRQNLVRRERNKAVRSELRTRAKAAVAAATYGDEDAEARLRLAIKRIDKAAASGVIHRNEAERRKSRLMAKVNRATADLDDAEAEAAEADEDEAEPAEA